MQQPESLRANRLWKNVASEASARVVYLATRFFIPPFVLSRIGLEAYGLYGTVFMLVAYFGISAIGFSNAYIKFVAERVAANQREQANRLLSTGVTVMAILGLAGFGSFALSWPWLARWMRVPPALASDGRVLAFLIVGVFFLSLALSVYRDALTGLQEIAVVQKVWIVSFVLETILIFALLTAGLGLPALGWAFVVRTLFELAGNWYAARQRVPWLRVRLVRPDRDSIRALAGFGGIVQVNSFLSILLNSVERLAAAPLLGLGACGLLDIGKRFPAMAASIPSSFASSLLPSAAELHARTGDWSILSQLYLATSRYMSLVSGSLFAFLCFFALPSLRFWLAEVPSGAVVVMVLFSLSSQIHMLTGTGTSLVKAAGQPRLEFHYTLANVMAVALLMPMAWLATGGWSVTSIAASIALATALSATWFLVRLNRRLGISIVVFAREVLLPGVIPHLAAALVWIPLHELPLHSRWEAAAALMVSGAAYLLLLVIAVLTLSATDSERTALRQALVRMQARLVPSAVSCAPNSPASTSRGPANR